MIADVTINRTKAPKTASEQSFFATHAPWLGEKVKTFHPFRLDETNQCLWRGDSRLTLTPKPFAVLKYLVDHPGRLITHDELLAAVWPDT